MFILSTGFIRDIVITNKIEVKIKLIIVNTFGDIIA